MKRPKPTKNLLMQLGRENSDLLGCMHHGLYEMPLKNFYPSLDLEELLVFVASSWRGRERNSDEFSNFVKDSNIYDIFKKVFKNGYHWLNKNKMLAGESLNEYKKLNPFNVKYFRERLEIIDKSHFERLKENLMEIVNTYVFPIQYDEIKKLRDGDNYKLEIMDFFKRAYPKKEIMIPGFASEIAKIISNYPQEYNNLLIKKQELLNYSLF